MSSSSRPTIDSTIRLRDGRTLGYLAVGKIDGPPIFHFHGYPSSRLEVLLIAESAATLGVRLIGLDLPGIGHSDVKADYRLLDWPDDVGEVADRLGIERFATLGFSGGGPYALACAYKIPQRLTACGLISTVSPGSFIRKAGSRSMRAVWWMQKQFPWLFRHVVRLSLRVAGSDEASIEKYLVWSGARFGAADHKLLGIPEFRRTLVQASAESYRQGGEANLEEALVLVRPWGFQVEEITFEKMFLWHGEQDRIMPVAPARLLAQALPHCTATFYPDEGHFSTLANHAQDILNRLCV